MDANSVYGQRVPLVADHGNDRSGMTESEAAQVRRATFNQRVQYLNPSRDLNPGPIAYNTNAIATRHLGVTLIADRGIYLLGNFFFFGGGGFITPLFFNYGDNPINPTCSEKIGPGLIFRGFQSHIFCK